MLIHRQNSYAPHNRQHAGCHEAQNHEPVNKVKKLSVPDRIKWRLVKLMVMFDFSM
jgi:hypothetical protein